jgi:hypothetical protein
MTIGVKTILPNHMNWRQILVNFGSIVLDKYLIIIKLNEEIAKSGIFVKKKKKKTAKLTFHIFFV